MCLAAKCSSSTSHIAEHQSSKSEFLARCLNGKNNSSTVSYCAGKVQIFWEGHKNLKKISHFVLRLPSNFKKSVRFFRILWPSHNIWTLQSCWYIDLAPDFTQKGDIRSHYVTQHQTMMSQARFLTIPCNSGCKELVDYYYNWVKLFLKKYFHFHVLLVWKPNCIK